MITITIDGIETDVDLNVDSLTLREAVRLEELLGADGWDQLAAGQVRPSLLRAIIWVKVEDRFPNGDINDLDMHLGDGLAALMGDDTPKQ